MAVSGILNRARTPSLTNSKPPRTMLAPCVLLVLAAASAAGSPVTIFDLLYWTTDGVEKRDNSQDTNAPRSCACDGPTCMCCVDFNLTYIDLGGPGCVQMKYISQEDGIAVNVSYGDSLLHSKQVKGPNPEPTCMPLLANIAEVCARFSDLRAHNAGLRACLLLEPKLLGDVTAAFNIGCFTMGPDGMKLEDTTNSTIMMSLMQNRHNGTQSESEGLNEEELIAAVNESAEQSLVFFGNLLGLTFGKPEINETNTDTVTSTINLASEISTSPPGTSKKLNFSLTTL